MVYNNANMKDALDDNNENENQGPVKESIEGSTLFKNAEIYLTHRNHKKNRKSNNRQKTEGGRELYTKSTSESSIRLKSLYSKIPRWC